MNHTSNLQLNNDAVFYVAGGLLVILLNIGSLPSIFTLIVKSAFTSKAGVAGAAGYGIKQALRSE